MLKPYGYSVANFRIQVISFDKALSERFFTFGSVRELIDNGKFCMFVEIMAFLLEIFASDYCVNYFQILWMVIQYYIKACITYILIIT